jgi:secreted trypsin-like serine protease
MSKPLVTVKALAAVSATAGVLAGSAVFAYLIFASQAGAATPAPVASGAPPDTSSASSDGGPGQVRNASGSRIVGGSTVNIAQYPWQAALVLDERFGTDDFNGQFCGGTFITPRIVQTAAHCVFDTDPDGDGSGLDPNDVNVVGGRTNLFDGGFGTVGAGEYNVQQIYYYTSAYDPDTHDNDLAWVVLTSPHAQTNIDVAGAGEAAFWDTDSPTHVSGWGTTSSGGESSNTLKATVVPVVSDTDMTDPLVYGGDFHPVTMLGAGVLAGGTDSCQGDSGGPLVGPSTAYPGNPAAVRLVGVVSFGIGCAGVNKPGIYARIANQAQYDIQGTVDTIEALESLPDGGAVYGDGTLTALPNLAGQSIVLPPPPPKPPAAAPPTAAPPAATPLKKCKKGWRLRKGKCVKKKRRKK